MRDFKNILGAHNILNMKTKTLILGKFLIALSVPLFYIYYFPRLLTHIYHPKTAEVGVGGLGQRYFRILHDSLNSDLPKCSSYVFCEHHSYFNYVLRCLENQENNFQEDF